MKSVNTLLILDTIKVDGEVVSALVYLPPDTDVLSCVSCRYTIGRFKAGKEGKNIRVPHRPIDWQLGKQYVWIPVVTDKYIQVYCPRCAEIELLVPRI